MGMTVPGLMGGAGASFTGRSPARAAIGREGRSGAAGEMESDVVIVGGGLGGCAAALSALQRGHRVIMTEPTDWIGGQLTQQAVPPDENPWIETIGGTRSYRRLREQIRQYYRRNYPLNDAALSREHLNPGNGWVSRLCHEPRVALAVLNDYFAPYVASERLRLLLHCRPMAAEVDGDEVRSVEVQFVGGEEHGRRIVLRAPFFVDATELGDLLPLCDAEYVTGAESVGETGEPHAADTRRPGNMQAFTACFAMDYLHGEDHTIDRPDAYDYWEKFVPKLDPEWPGRLFSLTDAHPHTLKPRVVGFDPEKRSGFFAYRRIVDASLFAPGFFPGDATLVNWPMNDYLEGNLCEVPEVEAERHIRRAKELSLCLLFWLQTAVPRPDGGQGWPGLRLRPDLVGTRDGLAKHVYVREGRRIRAETTVLEQHVGTAARMELTGDSMEEVRAVRFPDSVGIGAYRIDLHPSSGGDNYIDISSLPFQIPLGSLIPIRLLNMIPAAKNIGTTHITNGCYRLHPVEWNIGEAAGHLVATCIEKDLYPREVRDRADRLREFRSVLENAGVRTEWPDEVVRPL